MRGACARACWRWSVRASCGRLLFGRVRALLCIYRRAATYYACACASSYLLLSAVKTLRGCQDACNLRLQLLACVMPACCFNLDTPSHMLSRSTSGPSCFLPVS